MSMPVDDPFEAFGVAVYRLLKDLEPRHYAGKKYCSTCAEYKTVEEETYRCPDCNRSLRRMPRDTLSRARHRMRNGCA